MFGGSGAGYVCTGKVCEREREEVMKGAVCVRSWGGGGGACMCMYDSF